MPRLEPQASPRQPRKIQEQTRLKLQSPLRHPRSERLQATRKLLKPEERTSRYMMSSHDFGNATESLFPYA